MNSETQMIKIKKFDGKDFNFWKSKVMNSLRFLDLDDSLTTKPETTDEAATKKDKKALAFVKDSLSDSMFRRYDQNSTKELWDKLKEDYETIDAQLLFILRNKFLSCIKNTTESMRDYINRLSSLKQELKDAGNEVDDKDYILTIMNGTHKDYGDYVSAMTGKKKVSELTSEALIDQLIKEDDLRRSMKSNDHKNSMSITSKNGDRCVLMVNNKKPFKKNKQMKHKRKCYNCGIMGHYANECKRLKSQVNVVNQAKEFVCYFSEKVNNINNQSDSSQSSCWLLDSGSSTHVCNSPSQFIDLKSVKTTVTVGDNREVAVTGRGTVKLSVQGDRKVNSLILKNVALVPNLGVNLVSTRAVNFTLLE